MKHARYDYNRIQDPHGIIPEDEPVFLLRAQDRCAAAAVEAWISAALLERVDHAMILAAYEQLLKMRSWPGRKTPDMPA